jgi:hypothetical protein
VQLDPGRPSMAEPFGLPWVLAAQTPVHFVQISLAKLVTRSARRLIHGQIHPSAPVTVTTSKVSAPLKEQT